MSPNDELQLSSSRRAWDLLVIAQVALFAAVSCYSVWTQRYLYADGSYFLLMILDGRSVLEYYPARHAAHFVTQFPTILLLRLMKSPDMYTLATVYGATLYLLPLVSLLLAWWASREAPVGVMAFPMIALSAVFLDASGFIVSESHLATALFWPILYLLLFSKRLTVVRSIVLIALSLATPRSYESYIFLAWPLMLAAVLRGREAISKKSYAEVVVCTVSGLLIFAAFSVAFGSVMEPQLPGSPESFREHLYLHLCYQPVWFSVAALAAAMWCVVRPGDFRWRVALEMVVCLLGSYVVLQPLFWSNDATFQYYSRVQTLYVPLLLSPILIFQSQIRPWMRAAQVSPLAPPVEPTFKRPGELWRLAAVACVVAAIFQAADASRWDDYRLGLLKEMDEHPGFIAFEQEQISSPLNNYNWPWAMPSLSIALGAMNRGAVTSIVCAPKDVDWQPFDPRDPQAVPSLEFLGVRNSFAGTVDLSKRGQK